MAGLSAELYKRCRDVLLQCSEFNSDAALRAVFVIHELSPFRSGSPEATSNSERVDKCLAFLVDKRLSDGRPVLPLFLAALRDRYQEGNALCRELGSLVEDVRIALVASTPSVPVQGRYVAVPLTPQPYFAHPYPLQANFTGRAAERQMLTDWLTDDKRPILTLAAIGGMGKSSLAWYWLQNDVNHTSLDGILWWSFYEGESSFSKFLEESIAYASNKTIDPTDIPSTYDKTRTLVSLLQQHRILFILDGFERQLRAYASLGAAYQRDELADKSIDARACVDPNAGQFLRSLVSGITQAKALITTRLMMSDLEDATGVPFAGCLKKELGSLLPEDAVDFMRAQGVKGTRIRITAACAPYGYHPLSLRILSGLIMRDKRKSGDISVAESYNIHDKLIARHHHILEVAYNALPDDAATLLSNISAFRRSVLYESILILSPFSDEDRLDTTLEELIERGLLAFDSAHARYVLHPVVRSYAYDRLADKVGVHACLRNYFQSISPKRPVRTLDDLSPLIELFYHTVRSGALDEAFRLFADSISPFLFYTLGAYVLRLELQREIFQKGENVRPNLSKYEDQIWAFSTLGGTYAMLGDLRRCTNALKMALEIAKEHDSSIHQANILGYLFKINLLLGELELSSAICDSMLELANSESNSVILASVLQRIGLLSAYQGNFTKAEKSIESAQQIWMTLDIADSHLTRWEKAQIEQCSYNIHLYRATSCMLARRFEDAKQLAREAEKVVADKNARDTIRARLVLERCLLMSRTKQSLDFFEETLTRVRQLKLVEQEPEALLCLALAFHSAGHRNRAMELADEAQAICERSNYRLMESDILLSLARFEADANHVERACDYIAAAKERAWCDGPPHWYKPALDGAESLLQELARR